ncbi:hypothetical protein [Pseudomarimonas salicorniae]|uniref:Cxxc_20_cxxc protein n=1 Tax=Pseudomarimonas salicorniae TaxID=2933270 RepID=A0ABT0GCS9_9GAMM|nr:hypothetical protein [Lysobacter sp. CAU 1642]MCK7592339.1 hypothetical protein [Lysobacter sp. CAU 1642]
MIPATRCPCAHCGRLLDLSETHIEVPYRRERWWHWSEQRGEYRCPRCGGFNLLRPSAGGVVLYALLLVALGCGLAWSLPWPVLGLGGLMAAALLFRHAVRLVRARH